MIKRKKEEALNRRALPTGTNRRKALMDILLEHHLTDKSLTEEDIREEVDTFAFAVKMNYILCFKLLQNQICSNLFPLKIKYDFLTMSHNQIKLL